LRTLVRIALERVSELNRLGLGSEALKKLIVDARLDKDPRAGSAALPVVEAGRGHSSAMENLNQSREFILNAVGGPVDGKVEVCVVEYDIR
jgi:hypothetical protein